MNVRSSLYTCDPFGNVLNSSEETLFSTPLRTLVSYSSKLNQTPQFFPKELHHCEFDSGPFTHTQKINFLFRPSFKDQVYVLDKSRVQRNPSNRFSETVNRL